MNSNPMPPPLAPSLDLGGQKIHQSEINPNDVLCGRGKQYSKLSGNRRYRLLVQYFTDLYSRASSKVEKSKITRSVVFAIQTANPPGRFILKDANGLWCEIGDKKVHEKTSQLLRETVAMGEHRTVYQKRKWEKLMKAKRGKSETSNHSASDTHHLPSCSPPPLSETRGRRISPSPMTYKLTPCPCVPVLHTQSAAKSMEVAPSSAVNPNQAFAVKNASSILFQQQAALNAALVLASSPSAFSVVPLIANPTIILPRSSLCAQGNGIVPTLTSDRRLIYAPMAQPQPQRLVNAQSYFGLQDNVTFNGSIG